MNKSQLEEIGILSELISKFSAGIVNRGFDPLSLGTVLMQQALFLFRNILSPTEYDDLCKYVYETRLGIPLVDEKGEVIPEPTVTPNVNKKWMN